MALALDASTDLSRIAVASVGGIDGCRNGRPDAAPELRHVAAGSGVCIACHFVSTAARLMVPAVEAMVTGPAAAIPAVMFVGHPAVLVLMIPVELMFPAVPSETIRTVPLVVPFVEMLVRLIVPGLGSTPCTESYGTASRDDRRAIGHALGVGSFLKQLCFPA